MRARDVRLGVVATPTRPLLIVEDDRAVAKSLARALSPLCKPVLAATAEAAREQLAGSTEWAGFLFDVELPDGNGLDILQKARKRYPSVPALVITAHLEPRLVNRAFTLEAGYVCKPFGAREIIPFVYRCLGSEAVHDRKVVAAIDDLVRKHGLTPSERDLVVEAIRGTPRAALASVRNVTEATVKTQVRSILFKVGAENLDAVALRIYRAAAAEGVMTLG